MVSVLGDLVGVLCDLGCIDDFHSFSPSFVYRS